MINKNFRFVNKSFFSDSDMNIEFTSQLEKDATDAKALRVTPTK